MAYPDAPLLKYAQAVKEIANVPVIAVGRLGSPSVAGSVVDDGFADFVSLGRTLVADPGWPDKVRQGRSIRPCLACNTCANEMRAGEKMACVVNPAAGRELAFPSPVACARKRIAVIGAGPAGLTFAHLSACHHDVVVFERESSAGGAFTWAGKAPLFQDVEAAEASFARYTAEMVAGCRERGVDFRFNTDANEHLSEIAAFDEIVIATGAQYRWGLGPLARAILSSGAAKAWPLRPVFSAPGVRDWFYHRARGATGAVWRERLAGSACVTVIGDAFKAGKSREAIASAFQRAHF